MIFHQNGGNHDKHFSLKYKFILHYDIPPIKSVISTVNESSYLYENN